MHRTRPTGRTPWSARPQTAARRPASTSASRRGITTCGRAVAAERHTTQLPRHATRRAGRVTITLRARYRGHRFQSRPRRVGRFGTMETLYHITRCQLGLLGPLTQGWISKDFFILILKMIFSVRCCCSISTRLHFIRLWHPKR